MTSPDTERDKLAELIAERAPCDDAERDQFVDRIAADLQVNGLLPELASAWSRGIIWKAIRLAAAGVPWGDALKWSFEAVLAPRRRGVDAAITTFAFDRMIEDLTATLGRDGRARAEVEAKLRIVGHYIYFAERAADDPTTLTMAFSRDVAFRAVLDVVYVYVTHEQWIEDWRP